MIGANGFNIKSFTDKEISTLLNGLCVGDEFYWRDEVLSVTSLKPFKCHCLWDIEKESTIEKAIIFKDSNRCNGHTIRTTPIGQD